jgi:hypothetical protein
MHTYPLVYARLKRNSMLLQMPRLGEISSKDFESLIITLSELIFTQIPEN